MKSIIAWSLYLFLFAGYITAVGCVVYVLAFSAMMIFTDRWELHLFAGTVASTLTGAVSAVGLVSLVRRT